MVDEPTSAEWVIGEWVTLDRELHPFEALELATVIEAVKLQCCTAGRVGGRGRSRARSRRSPSASWKQRPASL